MAVVRDQEKRAPFAPKNNPDQNHWSFRDVAAMAEVAGTAPIFLDADASRSIYHSQKFCRVQFLQMIDLCH